jgi:hypothetical protein
MKQNSNLAKQRKRKTRLKIFISRANRYVSLSVRVVGVATGTNWVVEVLQFESRLGQDLFSPSLRPVVGATQLPIQWVYALALTSN